MVLLACSIFSPSSVSYSTTLRQVLLYCRIIDLTLRSSGINCLAFDIVIESCVCGKTAGQIWIGDVRAAKGNQVGETFGNKSVSPLTIHFHVGDERTFENRAEVLEHAVTVEGRE